MSPVRRRANTAKTSSFPSGPWKATRTTTDPWDDAADLLYDATNVYFPDPDGLSGAYALPGLTLANDGDAVTTSATPFRGQAAFSHTSLAGVTTNFVVFNGKMFRMDSELNTATDVTPVGVTIDNAITTRVFATSFADQLIITDGVNKPWLATNLTATPITGTYIQFNASNHDWNVFGPFVVYAGSVFAILNVVNGTGARSDIVWSIAGDAATGYQQTNYDFRWTLLQSVTIGTPPPLTGLAGTNTALLYWRGSSIGALSGVPGPDLQGQATHDAISVNVGTQCPAGIVQYGIDTYFVDQVGRPYRLQPGANPEAIWLQMRQIVDESTIEFPAVTADVCTAALEPNLNLYIVAPWSIIPSQDGPPIEGYVFDARTGNYFSRFNVAGGVQLETIGRFVDGNGRGVMVVLGSLTAASEAGLQTSGYVWTMNSLTGIGDYLTTEATPAVQLTLEDDSTLLTTEGSDSNWNDGEEVKAVSITTPRLGYAADKVLNVDRAIALVAPEIPVAVSASTTTATEEAEGTPTPGSTQDGIARLIAGFGAVQGRGVAITLSPTETDTQWSAQSVLVYASVSEAPPDEN